MYGSIIIENHSCALILLIINMIPQTIYAAAHTVILLKSLINARPESLPLYKKRLIKIQYFFLRLPSKSQLPLLQVHTPPSILWQKNQSTHRHLFPLSISITHKYNITRNAIKNETMPSVNFILLIASSPL